MNAFGNALGNSIVKGMQIPKIVSDEVEGNQNVDGESVKFGKLRNISDKEYAADVAALKKKYNVRDGVSNMVFNDQYALMDPATGKLLTTSDFDKAAAAQSNGFRLMAGQEDDGLLTIYRSAFAADIEQVNIGGSIGFTDFRLKAGYETALFTRKIGHPLFRRALKPVPKKWFIYKKCIIWRLIRKTKPSWDVSKLSFCGVQSNENGKNRTSTF